MEFFSHRLSAVFVLLLFILVPFFANSKHCFWGVTMLLQNFMFGMYKMQKGGQQKNEKLEFCA